MKILKKMIVFILIIIVCICVVIIEMKKENKVDTTSSLSNTKIGWGIKKVKNNEQPDLGTKNLELINEYNGIALGNSEKNYIYLTFDLGYEAGYTEQILDVLKEEEITATFFVTAHYVNSATDIIQRMIDEGHIIGNHTVNHKSMPELSDDELEEEIMTLHQIVYKKFGYEMKYIRPPMGEFSERTLDISSSLGYTTVMWSFAYVDWDEDNQPEANEAIDEIISNLHNGEVMLLHATSKTNAEIMQNLITQIKEAGYEIKSIEEFVS